MVIVKDNYLISAKISVGEFFDLPDEDVFIELREPDTKTMFKLEAAFKSGENIQIVETFVSILPRLIISHSLMKSETVSLTAEEVAGVIESKLSLFMHILTEYKGKVLFIVGKKSESK